MINRLTTYLVWLVDPGLVVGRSGPDSLGLGQSHVLVVVTLDEEELGTTEDVLQLRRLVRGSTTTRLWSNLVGWLNHFCNTSHPTGHSHTSIVTVTPHRSQSHLTSYSTTGGCLNHFCNMSYTTGQSHLNSHSTTVGCFNHFCNTPRLTGHSHTPLVTVTPH